MYNTREVGCLAFIAAFVVGLFFTVLIHGCQPDYSNGERTGVVWKLSEKGVFVKSYEGELNLGGDKLMVPNVWEFSCSNLSVYNQLLEAQFDARRVTLIYRQYLVKPFCYDTRYVVTGIK